MAAGGTLLRVLLVVPVLLQATLSFSLHVPIQLRRIRAPSSVVSFCHEDGKQRIGERRGFLKRVVPATTSAMLGGFSFGAPDASAAPPIAIIAEELGYFPVTNSQGETVYVPKRVKRSSSEQAIELARKLRESGATIYTAYWCPHCARQKELLGREAWQMIRNVECAPKGYNAQPAVCLAKNVDGYPTWVLGNGKRISGERDLVDLAKSVGMSKFDATLEENVPPPLGSNACK